MIASRHVRRTLRELLPLVLVFAMAPWLITSVRNDLGAPLYRDPSMFAYASWCLRHGQRMYRDFAMPDGPLIFLLQAALEGVFGTSAHGLRVGDLFVHTAAGAWMGAWIVPPGGALRRVTWGIVGAATWVTWMLSLGWMSSMQREGYYAALGLGALALAYASAGFGARAARAMLGVAGFAAGLEPLAKHTGALYVALLLFLVALSRGSVDRRTRLLTTAAGVAAGLLATILVIVIAGSLRGFWFWYVRYDFEVYRLAWLKPIAEVLAQPDTRSALEWTAIALGAGVLMWWMGVVPAAFLALAIGPLVHFAAAIAQRRTWGYYFVPAEMSAAACMLALMATAWCSPHPRREATAVAALLALAFVAAAAKAPFLDRSSLHETDPQQTGPLDAGAFLAQHTKPDDRVFYYGGDPGPLLAAERLPAAPYLVEWMLDYRGALRNAAITPAQRDRVLELQAEVQADACDRLMQHPAALVVEDSSVWGWTANPVDDLIAFCPSFGAAFREYRAAPRFGYHEIFLRDDR